MMNTCTHWVECHLVRSSYETAGNHHFVTHTPSRAFFSTFIDMFRPTQLVCSIQGMFNPVHVINRSIIMDQHMLQLLPKKLRSEIQKAKNKHCIVRTYE